MAQSGQSRVAVVPPGYGRTVADLDEREVALTRTSDRPLFEKPLYTATEAAAYVGVPRSTFDTWVRGYLRRPA